ncbi:MAG: hypothetical protein ACLFU8_16275 [Anaerolineales bacterium]
MLKWMAEWLVVSVFLILLLGMVLIFWSVWPLLLQQLTSPRMPALNAEGAFAILMLLVILVGFGKLLRLE